MSAFPWTTLITATAPAVAALGAVGLQQRYTTLREQAATRSAASQARDREVQDAYLAVVKTVRALANAYRNAADLSDTARDYERKVARTSIRALVGQLHESVSLVELVGSLEARALAETMRKVTESGNHIVSKATDLDEMIETFVHAVRNDNLGN